jgi:hypothetical protein
VQLASRVFPSRNPKDEGRLRKESWSLSLSSLERKPVRAAAEVHRGTVTQAVAEPLFPGRLPPCRRLALYRSSIGLSASAAMISILTGLCCNSVAAFFFVMDHREGSVGDFGVSIWLEAAPALGFEHMKEAGILA